MMTEFEYATNDEDAFSTKFLSIPKRKEESVALEDAKGHVPSSVQVDLNKEPRVGFSFKNSLYQQCVADDINASKMTLVFQVRRA